MSPMVVFWFHLSILSQAVWVRAGGSSAIPVYLYRMSYYIALYFVGLCTSGNKVAVIVSIYAWFRLLDDRVDGDRSDIPHGFDCLDYLIHARAVIEKRRFDFPEDVLMRYVFLWVEKQEIDITWELLIILDLIAFDGHRKNDIMGKSTRELEDYCVCQDLAIMGILVKVLGGSMEKFSKLIPVIRGIFTKIDWLADLPDDLGKGLVNISPEELSRYGVSWEKFCTCRTWRDLLSTPGFVDIHAGIVRQLSEQWECLERGFGSNFGGIFQSELLNWLLNRGLVKEFRATLELCRRRLLL